MEFLKMYFENLLFGGFVVAFFGTMFGAAFAVMMGLVLLGSGNLLGLPLILVGFLLAVLVFTFLEYMKEH